MRKNKLIFLRKQFVLYIKTAPPIISNSNDRQMKDAI